VIDTPEAACIAEAVGEVPFPARIVVSNVAGASVREALSRALSPLGAEWIWVQGRAAQCGVNSGYADPAQLGSDRWAGLIGAWKLYGTACVVVNAGTTMTVDALSGEGVFLGGIIVPGLTLMREAMARGTAQLKLASDAEGAFCYFPDNTADAMMSGAINALAGAIDRMRFYMQESGQAHGHGEPLTLLSGGSASVLQSRLNVRAELVDNLVLEGLLAIAGEGR
jgi:type III pantothenate kinase